jgi:hypothetical protein
MPGADVFSSHARIRHITAPYAMGISWLAIMKDGGRMPADGLKKATLLTQRFEGVPRMIDSVK